MKTRCEGCGCFLNPDSEAYVCSYECTFCPACFSRKQKSCPHCGGELVRRPRRQTSSSSTPAAVPDAPIAANHTWFLWVASFSVFTFVALAGTFTIWELYRTTGSPMPFFQNMGLQLSQTLSYALLAPFVFVFALRYPLRLDNWKDRLLLYVAIALLFSAAHVAMRAIGPYAVWDKQHGEWGSAIWDSREHVFRIQWVTIKSLFFYNVVDDITGTFAPIVLIAHAISYYRKSQERETRSIQLEGQLAKAHLQSLKSQLQPHFLFNTMHSISALMLTDVQAADRMITRLGDLLRMNLEAAGTQITTLSRELDFVNCYLEIEKIRFEDKLNVVLDISPEALDAQVPLLLLQPLVDNAVKHGIARLTARGEIRISASCKNGELQLQIKDNGPGFGRFDPSREAAGLGLKVTRERLETLYGQNQILKVVSTPEDGVTVLVRIPFHASAGEIDDYPPEPLFQEQAD